MKNFPDDLDDDFNYRNEDDLDDIDENSNYYDNDDDFGWDLNDENLID